MVFLHVVPRTAHLRQLRLLGGASVNDFAVDLWIGGQQQFGSAGFAIDVVNEAIQRGMVSRVLIAMEVDVRVTYTGADPSGRRFDAMLYLDEAPPRSRDPGAALPESYAVPLPTGLDRRFNPYSYGSGTDLRASVLHGASAFRGFYPPAPAADPSPPSVPPPRVPSAGLPTAQLLHDKKQKRTKKRDK